MDKKKFVVGMIVFGSLWGFSECIIGPAMSDGGFPSGAIMGGLFAVGLMVLSRSMFRQPGMQLGMGLIAGCMRMFNPFGSCIVCSAIAIAAEAALFELIWSMISKDLHESKNPVMMVSLGVISGYGVFVGGYITTQILTPLVSSSSFYLENLIAFLPQILARGTLAAVLGAVAVPVALSAKLPDAVKMKDRLYYPTALAISVVCWVSIIGNMLMLSA